MARADLAALRATLPAGATLVRATDLPKSRRPALLSTAHGSFDALLGGGLPRGALVELHGRRGKPSGRFTLALAALAAATASGEAAALVDLGDHFDPQSALAAEVELPRLLWMRPRTLKEALLCTETVVAAGFALVVLDLGLAVKGRAAATACWLRLARAAADRETALLVLTPFRMVTGFAARMVVSAEEARPAWRRTNVPLLSGLSVLMRGRRSPPLPLLSPSDPGFRTDQGSPGSGAVRISFQTSPLSILPHLTPDERLLPLAEAPLARGVKGVW